METGYLLSGRFRSSGRSAVRSAALILIVFAMPRGLLPRALPGAIMMNFVLFDQSQADVMIQGVLANYDCGFSPTMSFLCVSENVTYQIDDHSTGRRWALRLHRPGYLHFEEINSELLWTQALRHDGVVRTPSVVPTRRGDLVAMITPDPAAAGVCAKPRYAVLFDWVEGSSPKQSDTVGLVRRFAELGEVAALLHRHARVWRPPSGFTRFEWTWRTTLGAGGRWGSWRDGMRAAVGTELHGTGRRSVPDADPACVALLTRAAVEIRRRIDRFGRGADRFGLVHADMRLANLLVNERLDELTVIDFDDCGFTWYLYDLAASLSFIEHLPEVGDLVDAWLTAYRRHRSVSAEEEAMVATFILLRRLLLLAWLGSHPEAEAVDSVKEYAVVSCDLADDYLCGRR